MESVKLFTGHCEVINIIKQKIKEKFPRISKIWIVLKFCDDLMRFLVRGCEVLFRGEVFT